MKLPDCPPWLLASLPIGMVFAVFLAVTSPAAPPVLRTVVLLPAGCSAAETLAIPTAPAVGGGCVVTEQGMHLESHAIRLSTDKALALSVVAGWSK